MKHPIKRVLPAVLLAFLLFSCADPAATDYSSASQDAFAPPVSPQDTENAATNERFDRAFEEYWVVNADMDTLIAELPPQLMLDEPTSYRLAQTIRNMTYFNNTDWSTEFDHIENAHFWDLLLAALYRTPTISMPFEQDYNQNPPWTSTQYPNHHLLGLLNNEFEQGRPIDWVIYEADVKTTFEFLFGAEWLQNWDRVGGQDVYPYYYYKRDGVFAFSCGFGGPMWKYAQILGYEKTADGYLAEAVCIWALDKDIPLEHNDVILTKENFMEQTALLPIIRYTFIEMPDGRLVLNGIKYLRGTPPLCR